MNNWKKIAPILSIVVVVVVIIAGIIWWLPREEQPVEEATPEQPEPVAEEPKEPEKPVEPEVPQYFKKFDPPVTFTQNMSAGPADPWLEGDTVYDNPYTRWMKQEMGIIFEPAWISPDWATDMEKLNIAAASGTLPDVMFASSDFIGSLMDAGQLMPLDDLIRDYASPLVEYLFEDNMISTSGKFFMPYVQGGKTYAMPFPYDNPGLWRVDWIRKDILDELGKTVPETLQELEEILAAYKEKYPDNIGVPIDRHLDLRVVMSAFQANLEMWGKDAAGNLVYGSIQPQVKQGLEVLQRWYKEGYLDKEFIAKDGFVDEFTRGEVLTWTGAWWNVHWPFPSFWENHPDSDIVVMPVLKGPDGNRSIMVTAVSGRGVAVRKDVQNAEALMYLLNESVDSRFRSDDKIRAAMEQIGYEFKYPYTPIQTPINVDDPDKIVDLFEYEVEGWGFFNVGYHEKFMLGFQLNAPTGFQDYLTNVVDIFEGRTKLEDANVRAQAAFKVRSAESRHHLPALASVLNFWVDFQTTPERLVDEFVGPPTETQVARKALLETMENETFAKIIMGELPLDAFDKFVQDWLANGGEQWTAEVNAWHDSK